MAARWYIVHAYSGFEKKVAQTIREQATQKNLNDRILEVVVPTEEVVEVRRGKKVAAERKFFPGYVLVKMDINDEAWHLVKTTPKVTGFLGGGNKPQPITDAEAERLFTQMKEGVTATGGGITYEVGEQVKIIDGPFDSFVGTVEEVNDKNQTLKVLVTIFGRATPVELGYLQVEKV